VFYGPLGVRLVSAEATLVLIKPDAIIKNQTGHIITRVGMSGLEMIAAKVVRVDRELAEAHYGEHSDKPFFEGLIAHLRGEVHGGANVLALVYYGEDSIQRLRDLAGATNPEEADPKSLRGSYGRINTNGCWENVIHASENKEDAEREIKLWFNPNELTKNIYAGQENAN